MAAITFLPPSNATIMSMSSAKWHTSDQDWEPHRARIRQLYLEEDKPLKNVMAIMERDYGFKATVKMYKNRITKWKLDKRNKEHEMMAVVRKKTERDAVSKASEFRLRGRVISIDDVHRYLKRKGMSIDDAIALRAATPPDLHCCTPNGVPQSPASPEVFEVHQRILISIRSYILGSVESKTWLPDDEGYYYVDLNGRGSLTVNDFQGHIFTAVNLLEQGHFKKAGTFLVKSSAVVRDILLQEEPHTLVRLMNIFVLLRRYGWIDCSNILLNQFLNMATIILPDMHPLRHVFDCLVSLDPDLAQDILTSSWESFLDTFERAVGALSASSLGNRLTYICVVERLRDPDIAEDQLHAAIEKCKEDCGSPDKRYVNVVLGLAEFLRLQERFTEAATAAKEAIRCAHEGGPRDAIEIQFMAMEMLADCQYGNFDDGLAESTLRQVIEENSTALGWQNALTLRLLTKLEGWLTEFGKHEEAAEVSEQVTEILRQSNDFL